MNPVMMVPAWPEQFGSRTRDVIAGLSPLVYAELEVEGLLASGGEESLSVAEMLLSDNADMWPQVEVELREIRRQEPVSLWN